MIVSGVYSGEAVRQALTLRPVSRREEVLRFIERLERHPYTSGDYEFVDGDGRTNQVAVFAGIAVTFWSDHAVKEVRIVDIARL